MQPVTKRMAPLEWRCLPVLLLALHALSGPLILPTLPSLQALYGGAHAQWAYSGLILGFGLTQIPWGILADRTGRRPALLAGLALFTLAAAGCLGATRLWQLVACRVVQGAGVAAAGVCARAVIRDLYAGTDCVRVLSTCFSWIAIVALAAPPVAGALIARHGMAGALGAYAAVGAAALAFCLLRLPETLAVRATGIGGDWRAIAAHPVFRVHAALTAFSYMGNYAFLTGSPFLLMGRHGLSVAAYGTVLSSASLCYLLGTVACRRAVRRLGVARTVCAASVLGLAAAAVMLAAAWTGIGGAWGIVAGYLGYVCAHAVHQSCGQGAALAPFPGMAAQASALLGTILPVAAVATSGLLAPALADSPLALPAAMLGAAGLVALTAWCGVRAHGDIGQR